jgi:hypothetical protein
MRLQLALVAVSLFSANGVARADTISTFNAVGSFDDGSTLSGTVTIDTTAGTITGEDLVVSSPFSATFVDDIYGQGANGGEYIFNSEADGAYLILPLATGSLVGYTGGGFEWAANAERGPSTHIQMTYLTSGDLEPEAPSVTPEPSSIALLGTGLLGIAGLVRRRFAR